MTSPDGQSPVPGRVSVLENKVRSLEKGYSSASSPALRQQDLMQGTNLSKIMRDMEESGWLSDKSALKESVSPSTPQTIPPWRTATPGSSTTMPDMGVGTTLSSIQAKAEALAASRAALGSSSTSQPPTTRFPGFGTPPAATIPATIANDVEGSGPRGGQAAENTGSTSPAPPVSTSPRGIRTPLRGEAISSTALALPRDASSTASPNSTSLLSLIRRELDHVETRLKAQMSQVKEGLGSTIQKNDKLREVAISRLDQKVAQCEVAQSKLDRKVSELSGTLRGLSDEAQAQIRRADTVDSRLWEFRHTLEEEFRQKLADVGLQLQEMSSNCRIALSAGEDMQKRLSAQMKRMETQVQEVSDLERNQIFISLKARLESMEMVYTREAENTKAACEELVAAAAGKQPEGNQEATDARLWQCEQQLCDLMQKVERVLVEAHGDRGWDARFQEHEVRLQGIRSKLDSQETHLIGADDRFRQECEQRFDQTRKGIQEVATKQLESQERLEILARTSQVSEAAITELALRLQTVASDVAKQGGALQVAEQTINPQAQQIESLCETLQTMFSQVRGKDEEMSTIRSRMRDIDTNVSMRDQKERETSMDILRRLTKLESEVSHIGSPVPLSPVVQAQAASERTLQTLTDRTKETERNWSGHMQEIRQDLSGIVEQISCQDQVTKRATEMARSTSQAMEAMQLRLDRIEQQSGSMASTVAQVNGSYAMDPRSQESIKEMGVQIKDLMLRMPTAERLSKHFAELKTLAAKLTEVQQDTQRHLVYAEVNSPSQTTFPGSGEKVMTPRSEVGGQGGLAVKELSSRVAANEVAVQFVRSQVAEMWDALVSLRGKVSPRSIAKMSEAVNGYQVSDIGNGADAVTQELGGLFQRVEEGEMECAKLQEQLKGRIATMDQLLDKVAREVLGPEGADVAAAVALAVGAVEQISQSLPKGLRLCLLGSFSGDTPFSRPSSRLLIEAIARQVSNSLGDDIVVLTCGMPGAQETFVRSLSPNVNVVNLVAEDGHYSYGIGTDVRAGTTLEDRMVLLGQLGHVYITVEGSSIVAKEAKAAFARGALVIPLICTGEASEGKHDFPQAALRKPAFATDEQWRKLSLADQPEQTASSVLEMIQASKSHIGNGNGFV